MPDLWSVIDFFSPKRLRKARGGEDDRALFVERYRAFRKVLQYNNEVLLAIGDMQEKASGAFAFDMAYVRSAYGAVAEGVRSIIDNLDRLSDNGYPDLHNAFRETDTAVRRQLSTRITIPRVDYTLRLEEVDQQQIPAAGGKSALLGELGQALDLPVPSGFVITTRAYQDFAVANGIQDLLQEKTRRLDVRDFEQLQAVSRQMQTLVRQSSVPSEVAEAIEAGYKNLEQETAAPDVRVSVRSSAVQEDMLASFAGQYESALNVSADQLLDRYKQVLASLFTPRALFYYKQKGFAVEEMAMAVAVIAMVGARSSGIIYSRDPADPSADILLINAVWGLGTYAVGGIVPPETYRVAGEIAKRIERESTGRQDKMLASEPSGGTREMPIPEELAGRSCLDDEQVASLTAMARKAEAHFGRPQDMEWAVDARGRLFFLQTRPLRLAAHRPPVQRRRRALSSDHEVLLEGGTIACRGVGAGPVHIVRNSEDLARFPEKSVLVVRHTHPEYALVLQKASAVVADIGNVLGHLATVAREYDVPALFGAEKATQCLRDGQQVTVDAYYGTVYAGVVDAIVKEGQRAAAAADTPALRTLREILRMITPLNLTDPRSAEFNPKACRTLHDITRFAHEVAMRSIFSLSRESRFAEHSAKRLVSDVPLQWWVIDLENGLAPDARGRKVSPQQITSVPMQALWAGMIAVPWKGPPPVDAKGFLSAVFTATTEPGFEPGLGREFAEKNYILVAENFCNVSTRLGFHFSTIEAYLGDKPNQNYVSFVYTGGGGDADRKSRRAALIGRVLEAFDFRVERRADTLFARIEGHRRPFLEERLKAIGHLIVHTRQMDMVMYNDKMIEWYYRDIMKGIGSFMPIP
jgi:pyruvate,water dikinase